MKKQKNLKSQIESILLVAGRPMSLIDISMLLGTAVSEVEQEIKNLIWEYKERGLRIVKRGKEFLLVSAPENAELVSVFLNEELRHDLTTAALETLAIIVYKQPITRAEIEEIRGTDSSRAVRSLLLRGLIEEKGRKETPGHPILYGSSLKLINYLGLENESQIPDFQTSIN